MSEPRGSLIYLMRFLEGHLSPSETADARIRLDSPDWQSAWQRIQLAAVESPLPVTTWDEPAVSAETLAAFVEGSLSIDEATDVERQCWDSPELLRELVSTFRFLHVDVASAATDVSQPSRQATERFLALIPGSESPPASEPPSSPARTAINISTGDKTIDGWESHRHDENDAGLPVVADARRQAISKRLRRRRTPVWLVYAATIVIGLGLGLSVVVFVSRSQNNPSSPRDNIASPNDGSAPIENGPRDGVPAPNPDAPAPDPSRPDDTVPISPAPLDAPPNRPFDLVNDDTPKFESTDPVPRPRPQPTATAANNTPRRIRSLEVDWDKIDGLLVAREDAAAPWQGARADTYRSAASTYATLPDSWASARTNHGKIVLASDSEVHLDGTPDTIEMNVARGRVAISEIPTAQKVRLQVGQKSWIIQPMEEDTAIGCVIFARQSQLVVRRGKVSIAGEEIGAGRQIALGDDRPTMSAPIAKSTAWFTRPEKSSKLPAATRDFLLASRDVRAELAKIWHTDDHPARLLAARWSLAIGPNQALPQALASRDPKLRVAALQWLLSNQPDDPRVSSALRLLARQTKDTQMMRNVRNWLISAQAKRRVSRDEADRMVLGLRSDHLAIRQISAFFLENAFGDRVAFDPVSGPVARQRAATEWRAFLDRYYRAAAATLRKAADR